MNLKNREPNSKLRQRLLSFLRRKTSKKRLLRTSKKVAKGLEALQALRMAQLTKAHGAPRNRNRGDAQGVPGRGQLKIQNDFKGCLCSCFCWLINCRWVGYTPTEKNTSRMFYLLFLCFLFFWVDCWLVKSVTHQRKNVNDLRFGFLFWFFCVSCWLVGPESTNAN